MLCAEITAMKKNTIKNATNNVVNITQEINHFTSLLDEPIYAIKLTIITAIELINIAFGNHLTNLSSKSERSLNHKK